MINFNETSLLKQIGIFVKYTNALAVINYRYKTAHDASVVHAFIRSYSMVGLTNMHAKYTTHTQTMMSIHSYLSIRFTTCNLK